MLPKEDDSDSDSTLHRGWSKNTIGRFIPNNIVENHLEYDDKIIEKIIYFITKASGKYNYQIHNIPAGTDRSLYYIFKMIDEDLLTHGYI
jgi:hypothetical protein